MAVDKINRTVCDADFSVFSPLCYNPVEGMLAGKTSDGEHPEHRPTIRSSRLDGNFESWRGECAPVWRGPGVL